MDGSYIPHYTTTELLGPLRQIRQIFSSNPSNPSKSQSSPGPSVKSVKTMELLGPLRQIRQIRQNHGAPRAPTTPLWVRAQQDGSWELQDLNSSNGTRVNGEVVARQTLRSGDRVEIGDTLMIFTGAGQPREMDAAHGVDIVLKSQEDGSRIVSSLSRSGADSQLVPGPPSESESDRSLEVMYLTAIAVGRTETAQNQISLFDRLSVPFEVLCGRS